MVQTVNEMAKGIKISLIQPKICSENEKNISHIESLIDIAISDNPDIICLPERWYHIEFSQLLEETGKLKPNFQINQLFQEKRGEQYKKVQYWAQKYHTPIISGGIWEEDQTSGKKNINCYYFDAKGEEKFCQSKIHLYGIEKELVEPGEKLVVFYDKRLDLKFSILICFDLHISSYLLGQTVFHGADLIFSPTLIRDDGMENWKIYLQARALEFRILIASCNSIYEIYGRKFSGKSKIATFETGAASPVKLLLHEMDENAGVFTKIIDIDFPHSIRKKRLQERLENGKISVSELP